MKRNKSISKKDCLKNKILSSNTFKVFFIVFFLLFLILLGFYPGIVSYDGNNQWQQVQSGIITNAHPFFSTFFMLILSKIWNRVTIMIIYQILLFAFTWSYLVKVLDLKDKKQRILSYITTTIIVLIPITCIFEITLWKDIIYTSYLLICGIMFFELSRNNYKLSIWKYSLIGLMIAMVFSYRHNGMIVAILLLIIFYIVCIRKYIKKKMDKINFKRSFLVFATFVFIIFLISIPKKIILNESDKKIKKDSTYSESYSTIDGYMLWMMGAHIKDNNIKNAKDKKFLNKIIPIKDWKKVYDPYLINTTSLAKTLNKKYVIEKSSKFESIFLKYTKKYPFTIVRHYFSSDALLFNPVSSMYGYVYVYCFPEMSNLPEYTIFRPKLPFVKSFYMKIINISLIKPLNIFYQPAFILYFSLILLIVLTKKVYGKKIWLFSLPMLLNTLSLTPINLAQDLRYVYINYLTFYGLVLMVIINYKEIFSKKNNNKKAVSKT